MALKKETALATLRDPFSLLRQMTSEFDRIFGEPAFPSFRLPALRAQTAPEGSKWFPEIDVFEKDNRLVTKIDLPGMKKEDVKVEVTDGQLAISGERKSEAEEKKENFYRCEREYGSFYRAVPLPEGVKLEDVRATFADGVLEVSIPMPPKAEAKVRTVEIQEPPKPAAKTAA
jgi:HSP20 family protein